MELNPSQPEKALASISITLAPRVNVPEKPLQPKKEFGPILGPPLAQLRIVKSPVKPLQPSKAPSFSSPQPIAPILSTEFGMTRSPVKPLQP